MNKASQEAIRVLGKRCRRLRKLVANLEHARNQDRQKYEVLEMSYHFEKQGREDLRRQLEAMSEREQSERAWAESERESHKLTAEALEELLNAIWQPAEALEEFFAVRQPGASAAEWVRLPAAKDAARDRLAGLRDDGLLPNPDDEPES